MSLGLIALFCAAAAAGWLLFKLAARKGEGMTDTRNMTILKIVVLLGLVAALATVKLMLLAFMVLLAAGGVMAIEVWREGQIKEEAMPPERTHGTTMDEEEALSILGLTADAGPEEIKAAHKKLIAQIHPDRGGTDYLAAKINQARDYLLQRTGSDS